MWKLAVKNGQPSPVTLGDRARDRRDWVTAAERYRQALAHKPDNPQIWVQYGHALKEQARHLDADAAYRRAIELDPTSADAYLQLGHVLKLQGRGEEAKVAYLRASALDRTLVDPVRELARFGLDQRQVAAARDALLPLPARRRLSRIILGLRSSGWRMDKGSRALPGGTCAQPVSTTTKSASPSGAPSSAENRRSETILLNVDQPPLVGGRAATPTRGRLLIEGWAIAREGGISSIDIFIDGKESGRAKFGLRRKDVGEAWPDWENSSLSGFVFSLPARAWTTAKHLVRIEAQSNAGAQRSQEFQIDIEKPSDEGGPWALRRKMTRAEIVVHDAVLSSLNWRPLFGLLLWIDAPVDSDALDKTLRSLRFQAYERWRTTITVPDTAAGAELSAILSQRHQDLLDRVEIIAECKQKPGAGLVACASIHGQVDLVGFISLGDVLSCDALLQMALASGSSTDCEFFYADETRKSPFSGAIETFFKPQWSPELLLATNYVGRLWCARPALLDRIDARIEELKQFGEYDIVLRCTEVSKGIRHVPFVLCERKNEHIDSPSQERDALSRATVRRGIQGQISDGCAAGYYRLRRHIGYRGLVSIIMPTGGNLSLISKCLPGLFENTTYQNFELIVLYNTSTKSEVFPYLEDVARDPRVRVIDSKGPFNFSRICNLGAEAARGDLLLFLNDDIEIISPDWIEALIQHAECPEVGAVGARLLYPDGTVQHGGVFWVVGAGGGRHSFRHCDGTEPGYFGLAMTPRNVLAVTGACIMMRKSWFEQIGRFDETHNIVNNDVDLCLRSWSHGGRVVYEPGAALIHHELATRHNLPDEYDVDRFWQKWGSLLNNGDPYYHSNLTKIRDDYSFDEEPTGLIYAGNPLFRVKDVQRILILKLDHIGDFIISVPAIKELQSIFPAADFYLAAPPATAALAGVLVPEITEIIPFEFFFARSGLGARDLTEEDLARLGACLTSYHFDLAIDLRKDLDTRHILRLADARWYAGYDRDFQFPWLDISLEREVAPRLVAKRSQVGDELLRLVDAVSSATDVQREVFRLPASAAPFVQDATQSVRPYVCVHPGAGAEKRQWPTAHFALLIDLLVMNHEVDVALIGSADEASIAASIYETVQHRKSVRSVAGVLGIKDLPAFLGGAVLFVGNNSGPKHIAAGLGVPTVTIEAGEVDAREWGARGPLAVSVQREMSCGPCYIATAEQCPRGLACLTGLSPSEIYRVCERMLTLRLRPSK